MNKSIPVSSACDTPQQQTPWLNVNEAIQRMTQAVKQKQETETLPIREALNRVLAEEVVSTINVPPYANSAMDGYALQASETTNATDTAPVRLAVVGEIAAGQWQEAPVSSGKAVKIMTGAAVPRGADAVLMLEAGRLRNEMVKIRQPVPQGKHVRLCGEDVRCGDVLLSRGTRLNAQQLGLLANSGIAEVRVYRQVQVNILATGSELTMAGEPLQRGHIYDSNRIVLRRLVARTGSAYCDLGVVPDDPLAIAERIRAGQIRHCSCTGPSAA